KERFGAPGGTASQRPVYRRLTFSGVRSIRDHVTVTRFNMADSAGSTQKTEAGPQERPRRARRIIGPLPDSLCLVCLYSVQLPVALHRLIIISSGFPRLEPAQLQSSPVGVRDK